MHATRAVPAREWRHHAFIREILLAAVAALGIRNLTVGTAAEAFANADRLRSFEDSGEIAERDD